MPRQPVNSKLGALQKYAPPLWWVGVGVDPYNSSTVYVWSTCQM